MDKNRGANNKEKPTSLPTFVVIFLLRHNRLSFSVRLNLTEQKISFAMWNAQDVLLNHDIDKSW